MALDGIVLSSIVSELNTLLVGGRIDKIAQPEKDELIISIRSNRVVYRLLLSAQASYPRVHLTDLVKPSPMTAPSFCMLLRKYINSGKILRIVQPNFERIVEIYIEHLDELGDVCHKILIIEIMGRHSNIILCDQERNILDSIKRISYQVSSVREVLPGRVYTYPPNKDKADLTQLTSAAELEVILKKPMPIQSAIYQSFSGLSPMVSDEICFLSKVSPEQNADLMDHDSQGAVFAALMQIQTRVRDMNFQPCIFLDADGKYLEFYAFNLLSYKALSCKELPSMSGLLDEFYQTRANTSRVNQKSTDIRKLIQNNIDRCSKKLELQTRQLKDTLDMDKFKIQGELLHGNLFHIQPGMPTTEVFNYYTNENQIIQLDPNLTPAQNAQRYYNKYNKKKRTGVAMEQQIIQTRQELQHLESIQFGLDLATNEQDLAQVRSELMDSGYVKFKKSKDKRKEKPSDPLHYLSTDGFHIYVGKNNLQNEQLTMKLATGNDWWFHAKGVPGSHVIVKSEGRELTDRTYEEAAALAAFYSKATTGAKVEIDYTQRKHLKKPAGSLPGLVIYHTNYSMAVAPSESNLARLQ